MWMRRDRRERYVDLGARASRSFGWVDFWIVVGAGCLAGVFGWFLLVSVWP